MLSSRADDREPLEGVFLEMTPELWDPARTRLTLLFDPGRIKRGLAPNLEAGYPLVEGHSIVVTVDAAFPDAAGRPLRGDVTRRYDVGPAVRTRVDPTTWRYQHPCCDSLDPLVVEFDRPLDRAILEHSLWVCEAAGEPLRGRTSVGAGERSWRFEPQRPWSRQNSYALVIDPRLEDLAGNSLRRIFDRDLSRAEDDPPPDDRLREVAPKALGPLGPPRELRRGPARSRDRPATSRARSAPSTATASADAE